MPRATTSFKNNYDKWKTKYSFLGPVEGDDSRAYCEFCKKSFSIATKGEISITEHEKGVKHAEAAKSSASNLHRYFARKYFTTVYQ